MLVQNDGGLEGHGSSCRRILPPLRAAAVVCRARGSALETAAGGRRPRCLAMMREPGGLSFRTLVPICNRRASLSSRRIEALSSPLKPAFSHVGHLRLVLGTELGQTVLAPDVGRLDADGAIGRHDPIELVDHLLGRGETDLFIRIVASAHTRSPRHRADQTRSGAVSWCHAARAG